MSRAGHEALRHGGRAPEWGPLCKAPGSATSSAKGAAMTESRWPAHGHCKEPVRLPWTEMETVSCSGSRASPDGVRTSNPGPPQTQREPLPTGQNRPLRTLRIHPRPPTFCSTVWLNLGRTAQLCVLFNALPRPPSLAAKWPPNQQRVCHES